MVVLAAMLDLLQGIPFDGLSATNHWLKLGE